MLDNTSTITAETTAAPNWQECLAVGDVVSYRFPITEEEDGATPPKARPCLVLDIESLGGTRYAVLAYGTTAKSGPNRGYEVNVRASESYRPAGLHRPTRFIGARRLMVPLTSDGFVCCAATGAPLLGRLTGDARERMHAVRARIHAERDIAADRRAERRARHRRRFRATRPFTVELRRSKRRAESAGEVSR